MVTTITKKPIIDSNLLRSVNNKDVLLDGINRALRPSSKTLVDDGASGMMSFPSDHSRLGWMFGVDLEAKVQLD